MAPDLDLYLPLHHFFIKKNKTKKKQHFFAYVCEGAVETRTRLMMYIFSYLIKTYTMIHLSLKDTNDNNWLTAVPPSQPTR